MYPWALKIDRPKKSCPGSPWLRTSGFGGAPSVPLKWGARSPHRCLVATSRFARCGGVYCCLAERCFGRQVCLTCFRLQSDFLHFSKNCRFNSSSWSCGGFSRLSLGSCCSCLEAPGNSYRSTENGHGFGAQRSKDLGATFQKYITRGSMWRFAFHSNVSLNDQS